MQTYIKTKKATQIGPLIQLTKTQITEKGNFEIELYILIQCNQYLNNVEQIYKMEPVLRVSDCMYCRYMGPREKLKLAYDKINVEAFESEIFLKGENYTIFVDANEEEEWITADVFIPKAEE